MLPANTEFRLPIPQLPNSPPRSFNQSSRRSPNSSPPIKTLTLILITPIDSEFPPRRSTIPLRLSSDPLQKKLSKMLASQWSREELTRFYKAYRKHGQIWKKVARAIRTKSPEMAENLYNVNKAFLSLPEDQGTADAFLAMMADRRNFLDICDNEQVNTAPMKTRNPKKRSCGKSRLGIIKDSDRPYRTNWQNPSNPSCHGRISNPKRKHFEDKMEGFIQHPVKKRTPRVPIHHFYDTNVKHAILSPTEELSRVEVKYAVGVQAVRQPLAGTSQNGGSPPPLGSLSSRTYIRRSSYVQEKLDI